MCSPFPKTLASVARLVSQLDADGALLLGSAPSSPPRLAGPFTHTLTALWLRRDAAVCPLPPVSNGVYALDESSHRSTRTPTTRCMVGGAHSCLIRAQTSSRTLPDWADWSASLFCLWLLDRVVRRMLYSAPVMTSSPTKTNSHWVGFRV